MEEILNHKNFINYLRLNKHYILIVLYFFISIFLKMLNIIDITIPCLFTLIFDIECFGCGSTRAFIDLISLDFKSAWHHNPIIFLVVPGFLYFIIKDYVSFSNNFRNLTNYEKE